MNWKQKYEKPIPINHISELSVGDLIYWVCKERFKRYAIITKIHNRNVWGYFNENIEEAKKGISDRGDDSYIDTGDPIYKIR